MGRLASKTCLVTGGSQGIGLAVVDALLREDAHVVGVDLRDREGSGDERLSSVVLDVTDAGAVSALIGTLPRVDVLVNCVGYVVTGALLDCSPEDFERSLNINVRSMAVTMRAVLPGMLARGAGSIVNIASVVSSVMAAPERFAYATSKAAVIGMTMSVARDYVARGVRCNAISPGTIDTPSLHDRFVQTGDPAAARAAFVARQPMGRLGEADEIAAAVVLLASDEARFMTGANIIIDGGMSL